MLIFQGVLMLQVTCQFVLVPQSNPVVTLVSFPNAGIKQDKD